MLRTDKMKSFILLKKKCNKNKDGTYIAKYMNEKVRDG